MTRQQLGRLLWIALSAALLLNTEVDAQRQNRQRKPQSRQDELDVDGLASLPALTSPGVNATVEEFRCKSAGFFANEGDCTLFYRCVDYFGTGEHFSLFHFQCAPGTIFDESISVCNHPEWVSPKPKCFRSDEEPAISASNSEGASTGSEVPSIASAGESTSTSSSAPAAGSLVSVTTEASISGTTTCVCTTTSSPLVTSTTPSAPLVELTSPTTTAAPATTAPTTAAPTTAAPTTAAPSTAAPATTAPSTAAPTTAAPTTAVPAAPEGTTAPSVSVTDSEIAGSTVAPSSASSEPAPSTLAPVTEAPEPSTTTAAPSPSVAESSPSTVAPASSTGALSTDPPTTTSGPSSMPTVESSDSSTASPIPAPPGLLPVGGSSEAFVLVCGDQAFHRHPLDCKLYYQCIWSGFAFTFNLYSCQGDTIYDEASGVCTSQENTSPCELKTVPALPVMNVTALPGGESTSISAATTVATPQYTLAPGSLYDCPKPGHYPYQLDCIRFYRCFEITPGVLKGLLYRCPPGYGYSKVTERCEKEETLGTCDISVVRKGSLPVPLFPLEQSIMVPVKDFDEFFSNPNYFYFPRQSNRRVLFK